ncbi:MAG: hypothetical protein VR73_08140 [Gammaproteobacteria bacterium BRH_c0]|nr:MAG: hypothetical protein VR73_08140 [Gammaproteobacteria bacterium BRH_c0]
MAKRKPAQTALAKVATGFKGFDTMTGGGLPQNRISVLAGGAGSGKTLFAMQALVHGIKSREKPGIFVSFEEIPASILDNFASFDWGLADLVANGQLLMVDGRWDADTVLSGNFDISGLLAAVESAARAKNAGFLVLDGIDALLTMLPQANDPRRELIRLQAWTERLGLTTLVSVKSSGNPQSHRLGNDFEDLAMYMADCVVILERSATDNISSRNLFIQKYRGSNHAQNKVPYVIGPRGIEVEPVEPRSGGFEVFTDRVATGIDELDSMLRGGFYRGSTTLISGSPGTAKTTLAATFAEACCLAGERGLYICFDEAPEEIVRNVASVGIDLSRHINSGKLHMEGFVARSSSADLLTSQLLNLLASQQPGFLVLDPVSAFNLSGGDNLSYNAVRLIVQHCKQAGVTIVLTSLLDQASGNTEMSKAHVSTLCDNWLHLSYVINGGERNRALTIVKSRGTGHSNQVREVIIDNSGVSLKQVYTEQGEVLMGSLRWQREEQGRRQREADKQAAERRYRDALRATDDIAQRIEQLQRELQERRSDLARIAEEGRALEAQDEEQRKVMAELRRNASEDSVPGGGSRKGRKKGSSGAQAASKAGKPQAKGKDTKSPGTGRSS